MKAIVKTSLNAGIPIFQKIIETAQGGFTLSEPTLPVGTTVPAGTVIGYDESTRLAVVAKFGVLQAAALNSDVTYKVLKGSNLAIGMSINLPGGTARAITAIDVSNANYDLLTVGTTIGVAAAAGIGAFVSDAGYNAGLKGLLMHDHDVAVGEDVALVLRGTVYANRIAPVPASIQALIPTIIFSKSY
jgi:hypothetical protein